MDGGRLSSAYRRCKMICVRTAPLRAGLRWLAPRALGRAALRGDASRHGGAGNRGAAQLRQAGESALHLASA